MLGVTAVLPLVAGLSSTKLTTNVKRKARSKRYKVFRVRPMETCRGEWRYNLIYS